MDQELLEFVYQVGGLVCIGLVVTWTTLVVTIVWGIISEPSRKEDK